MGLTSLQVCMDSSDWLQGTMHDDDSSAGTGGGMNNNSSSSPSGDVCGGGGGDSNNIMGCSSGPMRLKPPSDQAQKCPRCDSAHTKFCYYNNYSLSQPRYFCKTCRRYWTKGGTLRNIPVGGGCRKNNTNSHKNNKHNNKRPNSNSNSNGNINDLHVTSTVPATNHTDLHPSTLIGAHHNNHYSNIPSFLDGRYGAVDFADPKQIEALRNYDFMGNINIINNNNNNNNGGGHDHHSHMGMDQTTSYAPSFQGLCSPFGIMGLDQHVDSYQRYMVPYDVAFEQERQNVAIDVKPKLLALDQWQDSLSGYMGSWSGMINGYGSSAANPLV